MKRFIMVFGWLVAACVAVAGTGTSNEFRVDTRTGVRTAAATEKIQYSTAWATNEAAERVEILEKGLKLFEGTGAGCYDWTPTRGGLYEFEHLTYDGEATVLDKLTAAFQVPDQPISADEVTVEAYAGTYDGKGHGLGVSGPEGVVFRFATVQGGPFVETLLFTNVCEVTVWYEVSGEGYLSLTNSSTVKITPKSIEGATVILGDPLAYTGKEQRQTISQVTVDGLDVTYTVEGDSATEKGEHAMTLTGIGNFGGTVEKTYAIQDVAVSARQRYPWNGLVDLKFTIIGTAGTTFDVAFTATDEIGGTNVPMKTLIREDGSAASSTAAVSPGTYRWAWNAAADLPKGWTCRGVSISADANVRTYTVKFNANGGTGTMQDEKFTYGFAQPLTANAFKKDGCMFAGWATSADGEKVYNDEQSVGNLTTTSGGSVTLFAVWKEALYMVVDLSTGAILYLSDLPSSGWSDSYKDNKMAFRRIEPGTYKMGSPAGEVGRMPDEQQHSVTLTKAFYIGIFEVTQSQWNKLMGTTPSNFSGNSYNPVEKVSYEMIRGSTNGKKWPSDSSVDSTSFMGKLRAKVGLNFDLPTEAEWEYACRAGCTAAFNNGMEIKYSSQLYDGHSSAEWLDGDIAGSAIYWGDGVYDSFRNWSFGAVFNGMDHPSSWAMAQQYINKTLPVGMLRPNAWGLYDMHGNVCEWCLDWVHESNGLGSSAVTDPQGLLYGSYRAVRSGSWHSPTFECRAAFRGTTYTPSTQNYMIGFRVACPVD